ncbi:DUF262 domain-containing HNH endonuclease family protein [Flavobacterium sp. MXW15]|uniref:DUF262 domain-containing HNH endonuclease family protein n=1 Tax=Xanthomonas chitinilytica TaxID=2989819 RepID=A0ABT3JS94_9XANT|nr:DUF262 domain-containing protein [Xanthomonas sp. H13-6]MCW4453919.1 DUF262 domain-containing HNH endonuclease family protein [Flavobacterium sp. MXW15]MCW4471035.1 DUF262 domain-containing HNH endonuclease family protein [Xanthomonas sp. H13-6]
MKTIDGKARTISEILKGKRYGIDYYQREYRWQRKQAKELIDDLTDQFLQWHRPGNPRGAVEKYGNYFLGSIILSERDGQKYIVDGQQRLTTITLLLLLLHRRQGERRDRVALEELIYSERFGEKAFNIAVEDRRTIMSALFSGELPDTSAASESVQTIVARYQDLEELLQEQAEEIDEAALPYFCDWLTEKVYLIEISAASDEDAYTIFETMNDRGLSLTPLDMLKGYLLANIGDIGQRNEAARLWRERIEALRKLGKDEDTDAVKAWLRARYADSVRERRSGSENKDFERIGTEFHRWLGDHAEQLGLKNGADFFRFVSEDMVFYTRQYECIRKASLAPVEGLEPVYHVAAFNFSLQYPLLLAPLRITDAPEVVARKIRAVAVFLDILLARRAVNYLSMTYGAMSYAAFLIMRDIRGLEPVALVEVLARRLEEQGCTFDGTADGRRNGFDGFGLNQWSKRYIKVLLARMTAHLEAASGMDSHAAKYLVEGRGRYEIEHIWADHYSRHRDEFASQADFSDYRNRFGDLLLLPKSFNASYGDLPYAKKRRHYVSQNLLAWSLHEQCYERNPGFLAYIKREDLPFRSLEEFRKADLDERHALYRQLADRVWDPARLAAEA